MDRLDLSVARRLLGLLLAAVLAAATLACGSRVATDPSGEPGDGDDADDRATAEDSEEPASADKRPVVPPGPPLEGFKQLMPRGGIPALFDPQFVDAASAEIPDVAWVLGFEHQGEAYAYDLNILNHHEVVNHHIGGLPVAAVW